ncbi:CDP-alcohol phosphatidyltransferase family protein [Patescibacteria group bacterium]|nr:CDP-alcohol phosphatidyltransferase family protein [Patescibacteria group bacterium]
MEEIIAIGRFLPRFPKQVLARIVECIPSRIKPNHITFLRIVLVAPVAILFGYGYSFWSTVVLALAVISDAVDGALAKARGEISSLGEWLDPFADKLLVVSLLLVGQSRFPAEFVISAIALEIALTVGRLFKWLFGKSNGANCWGKIKMHFQSAAVIGLVVGAGWTIAAANLYLGVAVVLAAMSLVGHTRNFFA